MMWRKFRRLKLFLLLGLPVACFGQTAGGGSSTASESSQRVYAPPCISQVKQYIAVNCQITPTGGAQPYSYTFTGGFPTGMSVSTGLGGGLINGTPTGITGEQATVTVTDVGGGTAATSLYDHASRFNPAQGPLWQLRLRHGSQVTPSKRRKVIPSQRWPRCRWLPRPIGVMASIL